MLRPLCLALTAHSSFRFIMGALIILLERPSPQMPIYPPDWLAWNLHSQIWRWIHFVHVLKVLFPAKPEKHNGPCYWAPFPQEVTIRSAVNGKRRIWWWLLLCSFSSLRPICYKFVDDETSKHVVWIAKGEITRHALFHGFPFAVKALKQAALQLGRSFHWPLLSSVTAIDSPIMTVCQRVFLPHKTRPVRADRSAHICSAPLKTLLSPAATGDYGNMSSLS